MEGINSSTLDNLLAVADNNDGIGNNDVDTNSLLQQLLITTTSLKASMDTFGVAMNEMTSNQIDMQSNIDQLQKAVFKADTHVTRTDKQRYGHVLEVLNEDGIQNGGSDNDDGSNTNSSTHDDGNDANNNSTPDDGNDAVKPVLDKYNLNDEFDAEDYTFLNNDLNNDGKFNNDNVHENDNNNKALDTLRVSFGTANHINGSESSLPLETIDIDIHRNVTTELSFNGYQISVIDKSLHLVTKPEYMKWQLTQLTVNAVYILMYKLEEFVSNTPEAALRTSSLISTSVKRSLEAHSCMHTPMINNKSWLTMSLDEAILRARLVAAPSNKGAIIQELQLFKKPFDDRLSLAPDRLPHVWATLMTWIKEFERYYYLCTFFDYSKNVYGLIPNQQPENTGQFGVITVMYSLLPTSLSTYIKRNFFDVDRGPGDTKYKIFASPFNNKAKKSFIFSFFKWIQAEYVGALKISKKIKETSDGKSIVTTAGVPVKGVHSMKYMMDNPQIDYDGQLMYVHNSTLSMIAEQQSQNILMQVSDENRSRDLICDDDPDLHTYNQNLQKPPYVNTGGVSKHIKQPTTASTSVGKGYSPTNEICFKAFTAPSYKCTDPNCVRIHDKNKIYEVVSKNLKDMMEAKNSVHSIQEASIDAPIIDMEATLDNSSP